MSNFLSKTGLALVWAKVKSYVTNAVATAKTEIGNYTVNGKKISTNPTLGKDDVGLGNVTNDAQVKRSEMGVASGVATLGTDGKLTAAQLPAMKTVNGESVVGSGDIKIDLSLYKVVETLPTADIDANKIYLVLSGTSGEQNIYTEYMYVSNKWEKIGEYKAAVDLTPYVKFTDLATAAKAGAMSATDKSKLDSLVTREVSVTDELQTGGSLTIEVRNISGGGSEVEIGHASATASGFMSKEDKTKLDGIQELTEAEINEICV